MKKENFFRSLFLEVEKKYDGFSQNSILGNKQEKRRSAFLKIFLQFFCVFFVHSYFSNFFYYVLFLTSPVFKWTKKEEKEKEKDEESLFLYLFCVCFVHFVTFFFFVLLIF